MLTLKSHVKLWEHQIKMVYLLLEQRRVLWVAGMSTGKTLAVIAAISRLSPACAVIICPKAVMAVWRNQIAEYADGSFELVVLDKGTSASKQKIINSKAVGQRVVVVNYETARLLKFANVDMVVCDESHKISAPTSKVSTDLARLFAHTEYKICMTGTFVDDRPLQAFGQVRFLEPKFAGKRIDSEILGSYSAFFERVCNYRQLSMGIKVPVSYKNLEELAWQLSDFSVNIRTRDVVDMPKTQHIFERLELGDKAKALYEKFEDDMIAEIEAGTMTAANVLVQALRLHQLSSGVFTTDEGQREVLDSVKFDRVVELCEDTSEPVVVFTRFKAEAERLKAHFKDEARLLTGDVSQWDEWQKGAGRILVANIQAGNAGIDLTRARICIYSSIGNSRTQYSQSLMRVDRANQKSPVVTYYHITASPIDRLLYRAMDEKEAVADVLLGNLRKT